MATTVKLSKHGKERRMPLLDIECPHCKCKYQHVAMVPHPCPNPKCGKPIAGQATPKIVSKLSKIQHKRNLKRLRRAPLPMPALEPPSMEVRPAVTHAPGDDGLSPRIGLTVRVW